MDLDPALIKKYDLPLPRYTSYPTAPAWREDWSADTYDAALRELSADRPLSIYLHIPFCEKMCYFCGCNMVVSRNQDTGDAYVSMLKRELDWVRERLPEKARASQIHLGGGTPTFLRPETLGKALDLFRKNFRWDDNHESSIEVDPRVTTRAHLEVLRQHGFNRISMGLQDTDETVQSAINRNQSVAQTDQLIHDARDLGFSSINVDLIYGLPHQTVDSFAQTLADVIQWRVDRLAVYSFAYLPHMRPLQTKMPTEALPSGEGKLKLLLLAIQSLTDAGYAYIGMDHFALPENELTVAQRQGSLQRNFMGYTTHGGSDLIGFGSSAIGHFGRFFAQNVRQPVEYSRALEAQSAAVFRGFTMSEDDRRRQWIILELTCNLAVSAKDFEARWGESFQDMFASELQALSPLIDDGLCELDDRGLRLTPLGHVLMRPVAATFDAYLREQKAKKLAVFSRSV